MFDEMFTNGGSIALGGAPTPARVKRYNSADNMPAVASASVGVVTTSSGVTFEDPVDDNPLTGQISLSMLAVAVAAIALFYLWTRNVQGGG